MVNKRNDQKKYINKNHYREKISVKYSIRIGVVLINFQCLQHIDAPVEKAANTEQQQD
jgi:hypothetical protein